MIKVYFEGNTIDLTIPIGYYKGYYKIKREDAMYHKQTYTTFNKYNNYTGQIGQTIYSHGFN